MNSCARFHSVRFAVLYFYVTARNILSLPPVPSLPPSVQLPRTGENFIVSTIQGDILCFRAFVLIFDLCYHRWQNGKQKKKGGRRATKLLPIFASPLCPRPFLPVFFAINVNFSHLDSSINFLSCTSNLF